MGERKAGRPVLDDPLDWRIVVRLPRSVRSGLERRARQTRTPLAVLVRAWILERYEGEMAARAATVPAEPAPEQEESR